MNHTFTGPSGQTYLVGKQLGSVTQYRIRACDSEGYTTLMFKVATEKQYNAVLDKEAYLLKTLFEGSQKLEKEFGALHPDKQPLNYHFCFPKVIEVFNLAEQQSRTALVLDFSAIAKKVSDLVPLKFIVTRERSRVDPRTSAWILGKLLKMLIFTHDQKVLLNRITSDNVIIHRKGHFVALFDWSTAEFTDRLVNETVLAGAEIAAVAKVVQCVLGADASGNLPEHSDLADSRYEDFIKLLASGVVVDAYSAHKKFYKLIRELWPREYYEFTTLPL